MNELIKVGNHDITTKEYQGKRVVTFKDIDLVHERPEGTARKRFNDNKARLQEGKDFFVRKTDEAKSEYGIVAPNGLTLITERGYLMLVKSFQDDLAWEVQGQLVDTYFKVKEVVTDTNNLPPELQMFKSLFDNQAKQYLEMQKINDKVDSIREVVSLDTTSWRKDTQALINKIAVSLGGGQAFQQIREESYKLLNMRMGVDVATRLTNLRRRMAEEGTSKSKRDKMSYLDVIAADKKLIEGYTAIVKEMAIKYGI